MTRIYRSLTLLAALMCGALLGLSRPAALPVAAQDDLPDEVFITFDGAAEGESCVPYLTTPLSVPEVFSLGPLIIDSDVAFDGASWPICDGNSLFALVAPDGVTWSSISFDYQEPMLFVFVYAQPGDTTPLFSGDSGGSPFTFSGEFRQIVFSFMPPFDNLRLTRVGGGAPPNPPRIDPDNLAAPVAAFCTQGGGVDLYTITPASEGVFLARATPVDIVRARQTVERTGQNTPVLRVEGVTLWALTSGELQINDGAYSHIFGYEAACGPLPDVPPSALVQPTPNPDGTFTIINRPRGG